jgi:mRNA-degrading endonuclease RelE of RelBE toxin-antitoxin system
MSHAGECMAPINPRPQQSRSWNAGWRSGIEKAGNEGEGPLAERADKDYAALQPDTRKAFAKQLAFLLNDLGRPSLRAKKYDEANDIWQARVNRSWRFYFLIHGDEYVILSIIPHPD